MWENSGHYAVASGAKKTIEEKRKTPNGFELLTEG
jgi:hypothetical protein